MKHKGSGHVTETPDVSHIKNVDVTHEQSDVDAKGVAKFVIGLTLMTVAVYFLMFVMFNVLNRREQEPEPPPLALTEQEKLPPEPRLQSAPGFGEQLNKEVTKQGETETARVARALPTPKDPLWEINALRSHWLETLTNGGTDANGQQILPISAAKEQLLKQGVPARTTAGMGQELRD